MTEEQYYTPEIEDICSGYEYQVKKDEDTWINISEFSNAYDYEDNPHYAIMKDIEAGNIRVPYLTKEQIEAEGWKPSYRLTTRTFVYEKDDFRLFFNIENCRLRIGKNVEESFMYPFSYSAMFDGQCKSINEFRIIQKLLQV